MTTIWKFPLDWAAKQGVSMPTRARALSVGYQGNQLCLWAMVNDDLPMQERNVYVGGTGHGVLDTHADFVGTAQREDGLVAHVFIEPVRHPF